MIVVVSLAEDIGSLFIIVNLSVLDRKSLFVRILSLFSSFTPFLSVNLITSYSQTE